MRSSLAVPGALAGLLGVLLLGPDRVPVTSAGFTDAAEVTGGTFGAGVMTAPETPTVLQVPGPGSTRVSWTAPPMGEHGGAPSAYDVHRYPAASGGEPALACSVEVGVTSEVGRALECDDTSRTPGTHHYAVTARHGSSWRAESSRRAITPELTGPSIGLTDPADGYRGGGFFLRLGLLFSCGGAPACGTADDPSGIAEVRWSLSSRSSGGAPLRCWDGGAYVGPAGGVCAEHATVVEPAGGGVRWRLPGTSDGPFRDRGTYTLVVTAVDGFANTGSVAATVTLV